MGARSTTARQPKDARSMTRGGRRVNRWWGEMLASAVLDPTEVMAELCQSTAYAIIHGQRRADAPESIRMAAAVSEMRPMMRSAIGLRSWSCGGLVVWWMDALAWNSLK